MPAGQDLGDQILRRRPVTGRPPAPGKCPVRGGSVRRALRVLEAVAAGGDGITAKAVARRAGLTLLTTYRLLHTLVHEGCLVRLHQSRGYGLGYKLTGLHRRLCRQLEVTPGCSVCSTRLPTPRLSARSCCRRCRPSGVVTTCGSRDCPGSRGKVAGALATSIPVELFEQRHRQLGDAVRAGATRVSQLIDGTAQP